MLVALLAVGCRRRPPPVATPLPVLPVASAPAPAHFEVAPSLHVGLPAGCSLTERPQVTPVGPPAPVFFAPDQPRGELVVALPGADNESLRLGIVPLDGRPVRPLPRIDLGQPFGLAAARAGWLSLLADPTTPGRVVLAREGGAVEEALVGEQVEPSDLRCRDGRCVALTTRAMRMAAAGATILVGDGEAPVSRWQRADHAPEEDERPFVVAQVDATSVVVTTKGPQGVRFVTVRGDRTEAGVALPAPHGALDAIALEAPVVLAHGARLEGECAVPRPLLALVREGGTQTIDLEAPPLALFVRPLDRGALAMWLAPTHCGDRRRQVAYAARLGPRGELVAGPMAVADATGLALATHGSAAEVWLRQGDRVAWLRLRCDGAAAGL